MVPLLKQYLCFTRGNITAKSIDFWSARVVISCPTSEPDRAGCGTCGGGPERTPPPVDHSGSGDGVGCLSGPHLPPPGKVTSCSSSTGFLLPNGHTHVFGGGCWEAGLLCKVQFLV